MKKIILALCAFALCVSAQSYGPGRDVSWAHYADSAYGSYHTQIADSAKSSAKTVGVADSAEGANHVNGGLFNGTSITASGLSTLDTVYTPKGIKSSGIQFGGGTFLSTYLDTTFACSAKVVSDNTLLSFGAARASLVGNIVVITFPTLDIASALGAPVYICNLPSKLRPIANIVLPFNDGSSNSLSVTVPSGSGHIIPSATTATIPSFAITYHL
jgi:hypothetical protein